MNDALKDQADYLGSELQRLQDENKNLKDAFDDLDSDYMYLQEENKRYREARKRIEERYDKEYDIQANEYMGGIADGLMVAIGIIDKVLEESK